MTVPPVFVCETKFHLRVLSQMCGFNFFFFALSAACLFWYMQGFFFFFFFFFEKHPAGKRLCSPLLIYAPGWTESREGSQPKYTQNMCFQKQTASCNACSQLPQSGAIYAAPQSRSLTAGIELPLGGRERRREVFIFFILFSLWLSG